MMGEGLKSLRSSKSTQREKCYHCGKERYSRCGCIKELTKGSRKWKRVNKAVGGEANSALDRLGGV